MIKHIKNITDSVISVNLFGHIYDIPADWSLSVDEIWGGEETLRYIIVKFAGKVEVLDEDKKEVGQVKCPGCGTNVDVSLIKPKDVSKEENIINDQEVIKKKGGRKKIK